MSRKEMGVIIMENKSKLSIVTEDEIIAVKRAYHKEWRLKNKEKVKQHNRTYWTKKAAELKEKNAK